MDVLGRSDPLAMDMEILVNKKEVDQTIAALEEVLLGSSLALFHHVATEQIIRRRAKERFASEGDSASGKWAALQDSTNDIREHAGFPREHPINHRTGGLEDYITKGANQFTHGGDFAAFFSPGRGSVINRAKLKTAQQGAPVGHYMPFGWGKNLGTKPSPSATPPRPVIGLDALDLAHVMAALPVWIGGEVAKRKL